MVSSIKRETTLLLHYTGKNKLKVFTWKTITPPFSKILLVARFTLLWRHDGQAHRQPRSRVYDSLLFDSLPLIEFLPCTRRRKYFAVLLKWKAGHIVLYFLCVWAKLFDGSGCFSSCEVIRRWKMKNEAIRSVGYVMIICMQGNSNLNLSKYIFFSPPYSLWGLYIAFSMFYICFRFVCNRHWREVLFWSVRQYGGINLDILKIWQFHKAIIISVARHPKVFFCVEII